MRVLHVAGMFSAEADMVKRVVGLDCCRYLLVKYPPTKSYLEFVNVMADEANRGWMTQAVRYEVSCATSDWLASRPGGIHLAH